MVCTGASIISDSASFAAATGTNAGRNSGHVLLDPWDGVAVFQQNGRRDEAVQLRDAGEFPRAGRRLQNVSLWLTERSLL